MTNLYAYFFVFSVRGIISRLRARGQVLLFLTDTLQKEFEGDGEVVELDWKPLAEYGR